MIAPRYMYARRRVFEDVGNELTKLVGERGRIRRSEAPSSIIGAPSLDYVITDNQGTEIGNVKVTHVVSYDLSGALTDVGTTLGNRFSGDQVSDITEKYVQEHDQFRDNLGEKLEALPTQWIKDIPDLAAYDAPLKQYTGGHVLEFNRIVRGEHYSTWIIGLLGIDEQTLDSIRAKIKDFLGNEVLEAERKLYR